MSSLSPVENVFVAFSARELFPESSEIAVSKSVLALPRSLFVSGKTRSDQFALRSLRDALFAADVGNGGDPGINRQCGTRVEGDSPRFATSWQLGARRIAGLLESAQEGGQVPPIGFIAILDGTGVT